MCRLNSCRYAQVQLVEELRTKLAECREIATAVLQVEQAGQLQQVVQEVAQRITNLAQVLHSADDQLSACLTLAGASGRHNVHPCRMGCVPPGGVLVEWGLLARREGCWFKRVVLLVEGCCC